MLKWIGASALVLAVAGIGSPQAAADQAACAAGVDAARHGRGDAEQRLEACLAGGAARPEDIQEAVNAYLTFEMGRGAYERAAAAWLGLDAATRAGLNDDARSNGDLVVALRGQPAPSVERRTTRISAGRDMADMVRISAQFGAAQSDAVIDTGAEMSVVTESLAARAGYRVLESVVEGTGSTGATVHGKLAVGDISIGGLVFHNAAMIVLPDSDLTFSPDYKLDAILGYPQLAGVGRVQFGEDHVTFAAPAATSGAAAFELRNLSIYLHAQVEGAPLLMHLDTGAHRTTFGPHAETALAARLANATIETVHVGGAGGVVETRRATLGNLPIRIGDAAATIDARYAPDADAFEIADDGDGRLGQDFYRQFASYTIDFDAMSIHFEARE